MTQITYPGDLTRGPRFGVELEPNTPKGDEPVYRPALYDAEGNLLKIGALRLPYGAAFEAADRWQKSIRKAEQLAGTIV